MVIVPGKFIFLETPRTASKTIREVLMRIPGAMASSQSHVSIDYALGARFALDQHQTSYIPFITVTRHPISHLLSWFYATGNIKTEFWRYVQNGLLLGDLRNRGFTNKHCLNIYAPIADKIYVLEDGVENILDDMLSHWQGWSFDYGGADMIPHKNKHEIDREKHVDELALKMVNGFFHDDLKFYKEILANI